MASGGSRLVAAALGAGLLWPASTGSALGAPDPETAEPPEFLAPTQLTGDWGGARTWLSERGLDLALLYTFTGWGVPAGADAGGTVVGSLDMVLELDLERLAGVPGLRIVAHGIGTHGGSPSRRAGELQGLDNVEAPYAWRLFEAYVAQSLFDGRLRLRLGFIDSNAEIDVLPSAAVFVHSSFGMGAELGTSGRNGPSTFPSTALGLVVAVRPVEALVLQLFVSDGVPESSSRFRPVVFSEDQGVFVAGEIALFNLPRPKTQARVDRRFGEPPDPRQTPFGRFGKLGVGVWGYTSRFEQEHGSSARGTFGGYVLVEQSLFRERDAPLEGLSLFARGGVALSQGTLFDGYVGGGLVYQGLAPGRARDRLGLGVAAAHPSGGGRWEVAFELTWRIPLLGWLAVQPDLQVIHAPAAALDRDFSVALGARLLVSL